MVLVVVGVMAAVMEVGIPMLPPVVEKVEAMSVVEAKTKYE